MYFPDDGNVKYVMANAKTLKGTGYFVHRDFTEVVCHKSAHLSVVGVEVHRVTGLRRMPMVLDHLVVNRHRLTWEDSRLMDGLQHLLGHNPQRLPQQPGRERADEAKDWAHRDCNGG